MHFHNTTHQVQKHNSFKKIKCPHLVGNTTLSKSEEGAKVLFQNNGLALSLDILGADSKQYMQVEKEVLFCFIRVRLLFLRAAAICPMDCSCLYCEVNFSVMMNMLLVYSDALP